MSKKELLTMSKKVLLTMLEDIAREYRTKCLPSILRNNHMNEVAPDIKIPSQKGVDAILVDFVNYVGTYQGLDYGLYTKRLRRKNKMQIKISEGTTFTGKTDNGLSVILNEEDFTNYVRLNKLVTFYPIKLLSTSTI